MIGACAGTKAQRVALGRHLVDEHVIGGGLVLLGDEAHLRRHGGGHRRAKDAALRESRPAALFVDGMNQRQLPLAVQGFGYGTGLRLHRAEAVVGEVGAVGWVDTDQRVSPPQGHRKSATHMSDT